MAAAKERVKVGRLGVAALILGAGAVMAAAPAPAAAPANEAPAAQVTQHELIPGAERLSAAERDAYRQRMAKAATAEEKARIRAEFAAVAEKKNAPAAGSTTGLVGDAKRGAQLHSACFSCHGIERYVAPVTSATASFLDSVIRASGLYDQPAAKPTRFKGRIQSLDALREAVLRRNEYLSPKMTPQEIEDVVAYLNATYYKFPQQARAAQ